MSDFLYLFNLARKHALFFQETKGWLLYLAVVVCQGKLLLQINKVGMHKRGACLTYSTSNNLKMPPK